jgi:hypothetical protein
MLLFIVKCSMESVMLEIKHKIIKMAKMHNKNQKQSSQTASALPIVNSGRNYLHKAQQRTAFWICYSTLMVHPKILI